MKDLISRAMSQNFVPVVDDQNKFIGYHKAQHHQILL